MKRQAEYVREISMAVRGRLSELSMQVSKTRSVWLIIVLACLLLSAALFGMPPHKAYAASDSRVSLHAATADTAVNTQASTSAKTKNLDKFIGLDKSVYVLANAKKKVYVFKSPSKKAKRLGSFTKNNCIVVDTADMRKGARYKWLKVKLKGSARGYILASDVSLLTLDTKTFGVNASTAKGKMRIKICKKGLPYLGAKWVRNGSSMSKGIVCFQYAWQCLAASGLSIDKSCMSVKGLATVGKEISRKRLQPGDIVVYRKSTRTKKPSHIAIYIGNGLIINSSGAQGTNYPAGGIRISKLGYRSPGPFMFRTIF